MKAVKARFDKEFALLLQSGEVAKLQAKYDLTVM